MKTWVNIINNNTLIRNNIQLLNIEWYKHYTNRIHCNEINKTTFYTFKKIMHFIINFPCATSATDTILWEGTLVSAHLNLQLMNWYSLLGNIFPVFKTSYNTKIIFKPKLHLNNKQHLNLPFEYTLAFFFHHKMYLSFIIFLQCCLNVDDMIVDC